MADIVSAITGVVQCLSSCFKPLATHAGYISKLDDNLNELRVALRDLEAKRNDVVRKVEEEEVRGRVRQDEVESWFSKVYPAIEKANKLVDDASAVQQRPSTPWCYCKKITSTYRCGKKIPKTWSEVQKLSSQQFSQGLTRQATLPVVVVVEEPAQQIVGFDTKLASTWSLLMDEGTRMVGLYGMGGVGKTTLLTLICNKFVEVEDKFDVVIWVDVSKDVDKIQDDIGKRLGLYDENWREKAQREKKGEIHRVLKDRKPQFVLLLDGLWEKVSLSAIGVPLLGKQYKIVYTTRQEAVCVSMGGIHIKVECLAEEDALDLLKQISGRETLTGEILDLAIEIARKCYCSPLALQVIGKCLSSKTTEDGWRNVLDDLAHYPDQLEGMEESMFGVLKVSYDNLKEEDERSCFLYCALFPMAYSIHEDELIEYWIGEEGIIEVRRGRDRAKRRGVKIIETLVGAGLLLKDDESKQKVYMHNMIRDMALWIVSEIRDGKMFLVNTDAGLRTLPRNVTDWTIVSKMSLMNNEIASITESAPFPNPDRLVTLFLQNNKLVDIVGRFFQVISTLVVLDLSHNPGIIELPNDISMLVALRYLNLSGTRINNLKGIQMLIQLIHLDLESTPNLRDISLISGLPRLQVLRFYGSKASLDLPLLEHLEGLGYLELLTITVGKEDVLEAFLGSGLAGVTRGIYLDGLKLSGASFAATFGKWSSFSKLGLTECDITESETELEENRRNQYSSSSPPPSLSPSNQITPSSTWFKNLSAVVLLSCKHIKDLTWLIYAANLESLSITVSPKMEELISQEKAAGVGVEPFRKLQVLDLYYLDELNSIYWSPLSLPSLQKVHIANCPKLRKLPLNSTSVTKIDGLIIEMDDGWTDRIEWENGAESRFGPVIRTASVSQLDQV